MKAKLLFLLAINFTLFSFSQIELVPNPCDINSGTITLKYGENGDYSIFDPLSDPNLYLYTGLQTDSDVLTWDYHDDFADTATLVPLTYNSTLGYYEATFNPATRMYLEEPSLNIVSLPSGIEVFDWYFLIRNLDGSRQSTNLKGSDYGFGTATLLSTTEFSEQKNFLVFNGKLKFFKQGVYSVEVFNILGKQIFVKDIIVKNVFTLDLLLQKKGIYIVKVTTVNAVETIKMITK